MPFLSFTIPDNLKCQLTGKLFNYPVITGDGVIYSKDAILQYMEQHHYRSPVTGKKMLTFFCIDSNKEQQIEDFLQDNNICTFAKFIKLVKSNDLNELKTLNYLPDYLTMTEEGMTALQYAASLNHKEMIDFLQEQGADDDSLNSAGFNP